jgi:hypothetical protein
MVCKKKSDDYTIEIKYVLQTEMRQEHGRSSAALEVQRLATEAIRPVYSCHLRSLNLQMLPNLQTDPSPRYNISNDAKTRCTESHYLKHRTADQQS